MSDDKRLHARFPTTLETIYFTEINTAQGDERMYYPGTIIDKSARGAGLRVNYRHEPEDKIWLEGLGTPDQPLPARVCWVSNHGDNTEEYRIGVEFAFDDDTLLKPRYA